MQTNINIYGTSTLYNKNLLSSLYDKLIETIDKNNTINMKDNVIKIFSLENIDDVLDCNFYLYSAFSHQPDNLPNEYSLLNKDIHSIDTIAINILIELCNKRVIRNLYL